MLTVLMSVVWLNGYGNWCSTCLPASSLMLSYSVETRKLTISFLRLHCILHSVSNYHPQLPCHCRRFERCEWSRAILVLLLLLLLTSIVTEAFVFLPRYHRGSQCQAICNVIVKKLHMEHYFAIV